VFDPKGWALFRSFDAVKEKLDTRRGSNSELETALKDLGKAVSYKGMYGDVAIVVYAGQLVENDVKKMLCRICLWYWVTPRPAVCAPMVASLMQTPSAKVLTLQLATQKTGFSQETLHANSP
jgi:hypothetical protein